MSATEEVGATAASAVMGAAAKNGPPAAVFAANLAGFSLADWVQIATLLWLGVQMALAIYDRRKGRKK